MKQDSKVGTSRRNWRSVVRDHWNPYTNEVSCGFSVPRLPSYPPALRRLSYSPSEPC
jgi:hypothetical protein